MSRELLEKEYDGVVGELVERAELILSESKDKSKSDCVRQAIDDGFYYTDDRAIVLAWALESGVIAWGCDVDWIVIEEMLYNDIFDNVGGE